jgi:heptosyltransferase-3
VSKPPRLLAVHAGAIGDLIVALPALERMTAAGALTVMGHDARIALIPHAMRGVHTRCMESAEFHSVFAQPSAVFREAVKDFDAALVFFRDDDGAIAKGLRAAGVKAVCTQPGVPPTDWHDHAIVYYHACVDAFFAQTGIHEPDTPRNTQPVLRVDPESPPCPIIVHPGSGSTAKNWPLPQFVALAERLEADGHAVAWLCGPAEEEMELPPRGPILRGHTLEQVGAWLSGARLFVGNDSGMAHLAAACGCPSLTLFVASQPRVWAPKGAACMALGSESGAPTLDEAEEWARRLINAAEPR